MSLLLSLLKDFATFTFKSMDSVIGFSDEIGEDIGYAIELIVMVAVLLFFLVFC